jgi:hypothetical protein
MAPNNVLNIKHQHMSTHQIVRELDLLPTVTMTETYQLTPHQIAREPG